MEPTLELVAETASGIVAKVIALVADSHAGKITPEQALAQLSGFDAKIDAVFDAAEKKLDDRFPSG